MPDVSLMGPNVALPPEIQAQQEQLQIQQMIAQSLLGQAAQPYSPVVHTGGGNPFARDVPNLGGVISQIANSMGGRSMLEKIAPQQLSLAAQAEKIRQGDVSGVMQTLEGGETPGPYVGGSINKPPNVLGAIDLANKSSHPLVRQLGDTLMKAYIEGHTKGIPTAGDIATMGRNYTAPSVASSISPDLFGPKIDASKLESKADVFKGPGDQPATILPYAGAQAQPGGKLTAPDQPIISASDPKNPTGSDLGRQVEGTLRPLDTAAGAGAKDVAKVTNERLAGQREDAINFVQTEPKLVEALKLLQNADMGAGAPTITQARQWMIKMGVSKDEANKVGDTQTYIKIMMSPAVTEARKFNSRATQMEFIQFMKAFAADQGIDARAAQNIITQMILNGHNNYAQHLKDIEQLKGVPGVNPEIYKVPNFPTLMDSVTRMRETGTPTDVKTLETGMATDANATNRGPAINPGLPSFTKSGPPPGAIRDLKADPSLRIFFDQKYGDGAAAAVLGK